MEKPLLEQPLRLRQRLGGALGTRPGASGSGASQVPEKSLLYKLPFIFPKVDK
jgi:hypothetical protein